MKITAHVLVKNEFRFIWYAVTSVIEHVDHVMIWDTGSTDGTKDIIREILKKYKNKVSFRDKSNHSFSEEKLRQEMLDETETEWFMVLDGDEIWWNDSISSVLQTIKDSGDKYESIVVPTINVVGDIFHYQGKSAGNYHLAGKVGHYAIRFINTNIPGLQSVGEHGIWGWADGEKRQIQDRDSKKILFLDCPYIHCTFLERSTSASANSNVVKRTQKRKHEIGIPFPKDYFYPESLFLDRPSFIPAVWDKMDKSFYRRALLETPLRKFKRNVLPKKIGY